MNSDRWIELALGAAAIVIPLLISLGRIQAQARDTAAEVERLRKWRHDVIAPVLTGLQGDVAGLHERMAIVEEHRRSRGDAE